MCDHMSSQGTLESLQALKAYDFEALRANADKEAERGAPAAGAVASSNDDGDHNNSDDDVASQYGIRAAPGYKPSRGFLSMLDQVLTTLLDALPKAD